ncbi:MAG TPA: ABC transporter permease, partial [Methanomicrobiales archaeon]|nr:ABC transporter permease [Methanomicrobiales archaeon]
MAGDIFVNLAYRSVRLHLLRSLLAALGIVIGVVAITTLGIMGTNLALSVSAQLASSGNVIQITPYSGGGRGFGGAGASVGTNLNITQSEYEEIIRAAGANVVIPIYSASDRITVGPNVGRASILGLKPSTVQNQLVVTNGTLLRGGDGCLVGPTLASDFNLNLGSLIELGNTSAPPVKEVRVVGILQSAGFGAGLSTDRSIVVTDTWFLANDYGESGQYQSVNIIASDISQIGTI